MPKKRPLWRCPRCRHRFVTKNLWHSCVRVSVAAHFRGKPLDRKRTWDRLLATARACGAVTAYAQKTRLVIMARVRFAGVVVRTGYLDAGLWLRRRVEHPRLQRVEDYGRLGYGHHFRLERPADIDAELQELVGEAYRVGTQELTRRNAS
jgi:uncharacterized protein DUF5655